MVAVAPSGRFGWSAQRARWSAVGTKRRWAGGMHWHRQRGNDLFQATQDGMYSPELRRVAAWFLTDVTGRAGTGDNEMTTPIAQGPVDAQMLAVARCGEDDGMGRQAGLHTKKNRRSCAASAKD